MPSARESSAPGKGELNSSNGTRSMITVFEGVNWQVRVSSSLDWTPNATSVRASRFSSCQSSSENIVLRACRIKASIGAFSPAAFGTVEVPVMEFPSWILMRRLCGSELVIPCSRDIVPSGFRRRAAKLRFLN